MPEAEAKKIEASFLQFLSGMAVQTLVHLGKMANPVTNETGIDLPNAKYSLDLLGILQEKTRGNLAREEEEYLANVLRDLRLEYVAVAGSRPGDQGKNGDGKTAGSLSGQEP